MLQVQKIACILFESMVFARARAYNKVLVTLPKFNLLFLKIVKQGPGKACKVYLLAS